MHIEVETEDFNQSVAQFKRCLIRTLNLGTSLLRIEYINAKKNKDLSFFVVKMYDERTLNYAFWPNIFVQKDALLFFLKETLDSYRVDLGFLKEINHASSSHKLSTQAAGRAGRSEADTDGSPHKQRLHTVVEGRV